MWPRQEILVCLTKFHVYAIFVYWPHLDYIKELTPILKKVILNVEIYSGNHKVSNFLVTGHYRGDYGSISFFGVFHFLPFLGPFSNFGLFFILGRFCIFGWLGGVTGGVRGVRGSLKGFRGGLGGRGRVWGVGAGFGGSRGGSRGVSYTPNGLFCPLWKSCMAPNLVPNTT